MIGRTRFTTPPPPGFKKVSDWQDKRVRLKEAMKNGFAEVPGGTLATVVQTGGGAGLTIQTDACPHCGMKLYMRRVHAGLLEIVS